MKTRIQPPVQSHLPVPVHMLWHDVKKQEVLILLTQHRTDMDTEKQIIIRTVLKKILTANILPPRQPEPVTAGIRTAHHAQTFGCINIYGSLHMQCPKIRQRIHFLPELPFKLNLMPFNECHRNTDQFINLCLSLVPTSKQCKTWNRVRTHRQINRPDYRQLWINHQTHLRRWFRLKLKIATKLRQMNGQILIQMMLEHAVRPIRCCRRQTDQRIIENPVHINKILAYQLLDPWRHTFNSSLNLHLLNHFRPWQQAYLYLRMLGRLDNHLLNRITDQYLIEYLSDQLLFCRTGPGNRNDFLPGQQLIRYRLDTPIHALAHQRRQTMIRRDLCIH